jgi:hypothetical protein
MEQEMAVTIYDFAGSDAARRFSPFCRRAKVALAHEGLAVENRGVGVHRGAGPRRLRRLRRISTGSRDFELLAADEPIAAWRSRMLDAFGGLARKTPADGG